ncbi:MAG TPA: hypothetical protein VKX46_16870 [Ktedonobacteraceae bacterium]|nr:hypothetical protein [Ktedonobacteraceae bacterium]
MAQAVKGLTLGDLNAQEGSHHELLRLRLALGWTILFAALVGLFAVSWDIQWHSAVGRDRTLTAPHLFILGSIVALGIPALIAVLVETRWAKRSSAIAKSGTPFAGFFSSSMGAYLVGYGALCSAIAFPVDQYWHTLYGIDVSLWAPFHIMALAGLSASCLGVVYIFISSATLATHDGAKGSARAGYIGAIIACAVLLGVFSIILEPSLEKSLFLGNLTFSVHPLMLGAFGMFTLVIATRVLPWRLAATSVALVYIFFGLVNYVLIPQLMTLLVGIEQQTYLPRAPHVAVLSVTWLYSLIIAAVLLDVVTGIAQRRAWSLRRASRATIVIALVGTVLAVLCSPLFLSIARLHTNFILFLAVSLLLGVLGGYVGTWLGTGIGESIRREA